MKALLAAIKQKLINEITEVQGRVYIVPTVEVAPNEAKTPFICIKDGGTNRYELPLQNKEELKVHVYVFQEVFEPEASVMGNTIRAGVLDLANSIVEALRDDNLGFENIYRVKINRMLPTETFIESRAKEFAVVKEIEISYWRLSYEN